MSKARIPTQEQIAAAQRLKDTLEVGKQLRALQARIEVLEREILRMQTPDGVAELIENLSLKDLDDIGVTVTQ